MRQTIEFRNKFAAYQKKSAALAIAIVASCLVPHVTNADLGDPRILKAAVARDNFDMPAAAPIEFLALSQHLIDASLQHSNIVVPAVASAPYPPLTLEFRDMSPSNAAEMPAAPPAKQSIILPPRRPNSSHHATHASAGTRVASYSPSRTFDASGDRINFDSPSLAPISFIRFCMQYPQDCKVRHIAFRPRPIDLTKSRMAELAKVNRNVNRAILPKANTNGVMAEEWQISPHEGDCKDYAITKRHELLARGWPSRSLLVAEVVVSSGEHHVVLVVRTREEDLVLDNLNWNIRPVSQIRYRWVRGQQTNDPKFWSTISVARTARVAMNTR